MKKLTDKDAILCVSTEEAIAIRDKFGLNIKEEHLKKALKAYADEICIYKDSLFSGYRTAQQGNCKITTASKILNKSVSKKELLHRIEKLEKVMIDNTEVTVSKTTGIEGIKNERKTFYPVSEKLKQAYCGCLMEEGKQVESCKVIECDNCKKENEIPKITEVQVDCSELTKEQIQELADIVVDNGLNIWVHKFALKLMGDSKYFRNFNQFDEFGVHRENIDLKTITYQQFKDFYSKEKPALSNFEHKDVVKRDTPEIDWSKEQYVKNKYNAIWHTTGNHSGCFFEGHLIRLADKNDNPEAKFLMKDNMVYKKGFTLCTEPISLSN